jgi:predicted short-subunit dehydrogenase-like oxidoreductase (DUF2520 family)
MKTIVVIGSGNVAQALCTAIAACKELKLVQICARNPLAAAGIASRCGCGISSLRARMQQADLYILAVSDSAVAQLSSSLDFHGGVVAHTGGSVPIVEISPGITDRAVLYPLQTFSPGRRIAFSKTPLLIEGTTPRALECVSEVAAALSETVREVDSEKRARIHMAAVFAGNFSNHMYVIGEDLIREAGQDFDLLRPLIKETALKAIQAPSPRDVQTGPAVRGDYRTKNKHTDLLYSRSEYKNLYVSISENIWETSKKI